MAAASKGSGGQVSRADIVASLAADNDLSQVQVDKVLRGFEQAIVDTLTKGSELRVSGLGTFKVSARAARTARNPQTGQTIKVAARKVPRFTPAKALKDAVGGAKKSAAKSAASSAKGGKATAKAAGKGKAAKPAAKAPAKTAAKGKAKKK